MASEAPETRRSGSTADVLIALAKAEGTASHGYASATSLTRGPDAAADIADAVHYLCALHGRHPGVVDFAAERGHPAQTADWFDYAVAGFARERAFVARLVTEAGPLPSTPGQSETEAAVLGQRHAMEMLGRSDRNGCAAGASFALVEDWHSLRPILDAAAERLGVSAPLCILPSSDQTRAAIQALAGSNAAERAASFGAQQLLVQQRGLWNLLEARHLARRS